MRKTMLCLTVLFVTSCAWGNRDLWTAYETLPLEVENVETSDDPWVYESLFLNDGTYFVTKKIGTDYSYQRCSQQDDSVLFTFGLYTDTLVGVTLFNDSLYVLSGNFKIDPNHTPGELQLTKMDNNTMEVQKRTFLPYGGQDQFRKIVLLSDEEGVYIAYLADINKILQYTLDLEFFGIATFTFHENEEPTSRLDPLSNAKMVQLDDDGYYFLLDQYLFHQDACGVTAIPFDRVLTFDSFDGENIAFLQYDYSVTSGKEFFNIDRVTLSWGFTELTRERILSIDGDFLSHSHEQNNATLVAFTMFEENLFIVGSRNTVKSSDDTIDYGVLRFDLDTYEVVTYFNSETNALNSDPYFYSNGHFTYYSNINGVKTLQQINFRQEIV